MNSEIFEEAEYRFFFDIVADILRACNGTVGRTFLMYRCNMSFSQLSDYLKLILDAHLIETRNERPHLLFKISHKGKRFLEVYENLKALMR